MASRWEHYLQAADLLTLVAANRALLRADGEVTGPARSALADETIMMVMEAGAHASLAGATKEVETTAREQFMERGKTRPERRLPRRDSWDRPEPAAASEEKAS